MTTVNLLSGSTLTLHPNGTWECDDDLIADFLNLRLPPSEHSEAFGDFLPSMLSRASRLLGEGFSNLQEANPGPYHRDTEGKFTSKEGTTQIIGVDDESGENQELIDQAWTLASESGIRILSDKNLASVAIDQGKAIGALFTAWDSDGEYSFDVVVSPEHQRKGIATRLIDDAMDRYRFESDAYETPKIKADVVNPHLIKHLAKRGFRVSSEIEGHTIMTYGDNDLTEANLGPYTRDQFGRFSGTGAMAPDRDSGSGVVGKKLPVKKAPKKLPVKKPAVPNSASKVVSGHTVYQVHYEDPYPKPQPPPSVPRNASPEEKRARKPLMEAYRAELAQWENAVAARGGHWFYDDGKPAPKHIQEYGLSQTDIDVFINPDPTGHLVAHGWHRKVTGEKADKPFHHYNADHKTRGRVDRNARADALLENVEAFMDRIDADRRSPDPTVRDSAVALHLMLQTGMRVGNAESRKGYWKKMDVIDPSTGQPMLDENGKKIKEEQFIHTYGASTIEGRHIQISPARQTRSQPGDEEGDTAVVIEKGQVYIMYRVQKALKPGWFPIDDPELAAELLQRKKTARDSRDLIFPATNNSRLLDYMKQVGADAGIQGAEKLKVKDLRLAHGTSTALKVRDEIIDRLFGPSGPQTQAQVQQLARAIAVEVARVLKNTPGVALQKYVNWLRVLDGYIPEGLEVEVKEELRPPFFSETQGA